MQQAASDANAVRRRHVLFFGGFDPKGASWYHALYRRQAALQCGVNGMSIEVGPRRRDTAASQSWQVRGRDGTGAGCETLFEVIGWDAIVREHWTRSPARLLRQLLSAYLAMLWHGPGQVLKVARLSRRSVYALGFPLLLLVLVLLLGLLAAGAGWLVTRQIGLPQGISLAVAVACGIAVVAGVLRLEARFQTFLLARIYAFVSRYALHGDPGIDAVIAQGARRINAILAAGDCDELLVVGFSVGNILATRAVGQALGEPSTRWSDDTRLALLTLGNCVPLLGLFPQAVRYRSELARIAGSDRLRWVDVSSPVDWASFPLLDPLDLCGVDCQHRGAGSPVMTSPRFHTLFEPGRYAQMIRDKHAMHTLYLMSTERAGHYDWFAITAGGQPLHLRYPRPDVTTCSGRTPRRR